MADVVPNATQEFWQPPSPASASPRLAEACEQCNSEFMVGARFCHVCGASRRESSAGVHPFWHRCLDGLRVLEFHRIKGGLGLSTASLLAFLLGVGCVLCAIAVGLIYSVQTLADFQAIQLWRIEWLMAGIAAFVAAIVLKRSDSTNK